MILTLQPDMAGFSEKNNNNSVKRRNKQVNQGLKNLTNWLNENKGCQNISKTSRFTQIINKTYRCPINIET